MIQLTMTDEELDKVFDAIGKAVTEVERQFR